MAKHAGGEPTLKGKTGPLDLLVRAHVLDRERPLGVRTVWLGGVPPPWTQFI